MNLEISNFAKIKYANIMLDGLTVIAGENNTGKSTVGKLLFSLHQIFFQLDQQVLKERKNSIACALAKLPILCSLEDKNEIIDLLLNGNIKEQLHKFDIEVKDDLVEEIRQALSYSSSKLIELIVRKHLDKEFNHQYLPLASNEETVIDLSLNKKHNILKFNQCFEILNEVDLQNECFLIDQPFVINECISVLKYKPLFLRTSYMNHKAHIVYKLRQSFNKETPLIKEALLQERLEQFKTKIKNVIKGDIVEKEGKFVFMDDFTNEVVEIDNLSAGIKSFAVVLKLIKSNDITDGSMIVLDEPELHLHPKWQVEFAKLLVLLQKEFNLNIVLMTHSPYFIQAIEVYSAKYEIANRCNYYLSDLENNRVIIEDVTLEIDKIYKKLATPLLELSEELNNLIEDD